MTLTEAQVKCIKPGTKIKRFTDEKGMYLEVTPKGQKYWRLKYRFAGKEKRLAIGVYPETSLKQARQIRGDARSQLRNGIDPSAAKQAAKRNNQTDQQGVFETIAREWYDKEEPHWSEKHKKRVLRALEQDLFPNIGSKAITSISPPELLEALRKIEARGAIETAHRTKQIAGQIFRYGVAIGRCERDISHDLNGALARPRTKHLAAITDPEQVGQLLTAIDGFEGTAVVKAALRLSPLLLCRPGELRHMEWQEINWKDNRWEIPANKMKLRTPHIVPLCKQALTILKELKAITGQGKYVFRSARGVADHSAKMELELHYARWASTMTR